MNADQSRPTPDAEPARGAAADTIGPAPSETTSAGAVYRPPLWLLTLGAGLISGLISWAGGEAAFVTFRAERERIYPANYQQLSGYQKQAATAEVEGEARRVAERKKAAVSLGLLGLGLGVSLGLGGGWAAGSSRAAWLGAIGGGLAGAAAGVGLSWAAVPLYFRFEDPAQGLIVLLVTHAVIFLGLGGASALGLGLGLGLSPGDRPAMVRAPFGGALGGLIGAIALATVYSLAFPLMRTFEPIASEPIPRLLMYLCVSVCAAFMAGLVSGGRARRPIPRPAS